MQLILNVFPLPDKLNLAIDRTNWKFGKENINILTAGIVYKGIAIPFLWTCLPKRGNSNSAERISFMETLLTLIPIEQISTLLADREFIGKDWLPWLVGMPAETSLAICSMIFGGIFVSKVNLGRTRTRKNDSLKTYVFSE